MKIEIQIFKKMTEIDLSKLNSEELAELTKQVKAREAAEKARKQQEVEAYREMCAKAVDDAFPVLENASKELCGAKRWIFEQFRSALDVKGDVYDTRNISAQFSHNFINADGTRRIVLGEYQQDFFDDTADAGVSMVEEYLEELAAAGKEAAEAVELARHLLIRDKKGNLQSKKIMSLYKMAEKSGNEKFIEGVKTIMDAYSPVRSKQYVKAEYRDENGHWRALPLGMTEA